VLRVEAGTKRCFVLMLASNGDKEHLEYNAVIATGNMLYNLQSPGLREHFQNGKSALSKPGHDLISSGLKLEEPSILYFSLGEENCRAGKVISR